MTVFCSRRARVSIVVFEVDAATLLAAGAALGVAIGFAAQDILKNIFGGLVIIADRPFQVGDKIQVAGTYGEVTAIGTRSTRIVTPDDNLVSVPNSQIVDGQVANANAGALDCQVGVLGGVVGLLDLPHDQGRLGVGSAGVPGASGGGGRCDGGRGLARRGAARGRSDHQGAGHPPDSLGTDEAAHG